VINGLCDRGENLPPLLSNFGIQDGEGLEPNFCDFRSGHLATGLCGSRETMENWRDFRDSCYLQAKEGFAR
jgi:hypothetical protein